MAAAARQFAPASASKPAAPPQIRTAKLPSPRTARDPRFMTTVDRLQRTTARRLHHGAGGLIALADGGQDLLGRPLLQRLVDTRFSSVIDARVQAMRVSSPHDPAEREAHATAKAIVGMSEPGQTAASASAPAIARKADGPATAPHGVMSEIGRARGTGRPLPSTVRRFMEPRFGADFGAVRMHTGDQSARLNRQLNAQAFTFGEQVFFGRDRFQPDSHDGRELIAHELTHTIQQGAASQVANDETRTQTHGGETRTQAPDETRRAQSGIHRSPEPAVHRAPEVSSSSSPHVQRLGVQDVLDYFADKANLIPGFRMFTIVIGVNPVNMRSVDRSAANILRAVVEFLPGGNLITRALDAYGVFEKAGAWIEGQLAALGISGASIKAAIDRFIDSLSWTDIFDLGGVWDRAKAILGDPVGRILTFVRTLFGKILDMIKDAVLQPIAQLASQTAGWDLLCAVLGKNPITGDPVPRTAETLIGGFMKLIGQEEIWENIKKGNAIARAFAWFQGAVEGALGFVREIPSLFINTLKSLMIEDLIILPQAFVKVGRAFGGFFARFFSWAGGTIWDLLEIIFSVVAPGVLVYLKKAAAAFKTILNNPIGFVKNLIAAGKQGLSQFVGNFARHLKAALIGWLTGALSGAGLYIPQALTLPEIGKFVLSVLGITWPKIRAKIVKVIGETAMAAIETGLDIVIALVRGGPAAAWEIIKQKLTDLKDMVIQSIISFVKDKVVTAAVTKLLSMLSPVGAFIQAIIGIYNTIMFFIERMRQIAQVAAAVIDSISAIANGVIGAAANKVEQTMAGLLTLVISFLARIAGLGKVSDAVVNFIKMVQAKVDAAIDFAINWIVQKAKALFKSLFGSSKDKRTDQEKQRDLNMAIAEAQSVLRTKKDRRGIESALPAIKAKYKMTSLVLVSDSQTQTKEAVHVHGAINPEADTTRVDLDRNAKRPRVVVPFSLASAGHELTFEPQGNAVDVEMASGRKLPLTKKFHDAHVAINEFKHYMTSITAAQIRREFVAKLLPKIDALQAPQVAEFNTIYDQLFPKPGPGGVAVGPLISEAEAKSRVQALVTRAEQLLTALKAWGATSGIPDLSKEAIDETLRTQGDAIWRQSWQTTRDAILAAVRAFNYKGQPVLFTGSSFTGWRGPHKGMTHFDSRDFDVDLYVVHAADYDAAVNAGAREVNGKIFPSARFTPQLLGLSTRVAAALAAVFVNVGRVADSVIVLRKTPA